MIQFLRSMFGLHDTSGNRAILGEAVPVDVKDVPYVKASHDRLNTLHHLYKQYQSTPQAQKFKTVFDKTKQVHTYLVSKKRVHELELFHVQHTDHFISAFTVILDMYQKHAAESLVALEEEKLLLAQKKAQHKVNHPPQDFESKVDTVLKRIETETIKGIYTAQKVSEMVKRVANQAPFLQEEILSADVPAFKIPTISIDTFSRILYAKEATTEGVVLREIGFTSSDQEKEDFLLRTANRLDINRSSLTYIGNAMVALTPPTGSGLSAYVPVIRWKGVAYALRVEDFVLFPVKIYSRSK